MQVRWSAWRSLLANLAKIFGMLAKNLVQAKAGATAGFRKQGSTHLHLRGPYRKIAQRVQRGTDPWVAAGSVHAGRSFHGQGVGFNSEESQQTCPHADILRACSSRLALECWMYISTNIHLVDLNSAVAIQGIP